jgi:hypothetical protein
MTILHSAIKTPPALHATIVAWYKAALAPLGYKAAASFQNDLVIGFADASGAVEWWVKSTAAESPSHTEEDKTAARIVGSHFAFAAKGRGFLCSLLLIVCYWASSLTAQQTELLSMRSMKLPLLREGSPSALLG